MPGTGPTWLSGVISLPDRDGIPHLVASYVKIKPPLEAYERGLCVWNDRTERFDRLKVIWTRSTDSSKPPRQPDGHPALWNDDAGNRWVFFGNPLPTLKCPATFEAWQDPAQWVPIDPQSTIVSAGDGGPVQPHSGSIAWNPYRRRWVTVFMQRFGKPSAFGELWYAEADAPGGPWGPAVKVLSHDNYTFYNPRIHWESSNPNSPVLLFEGTYTQQFAADPSPTPRYDYNQILYRLDLDDPKLRPAGRSDEQANQEQEGQVAQSWVVTMTDAIRKHDPRHMITVGVIPWAFVFGGGKPLFHSAEVGQSLDFVSVHYYPQAGEVDKAVASLDAYDVGKPIVIEEMFPLKCSVEELEQFVTQSASRVDGWISFFWGTRPAS